MEMLHKILDCIFVPFFDRPLTDFNYDVIHTEGVKSNVE